MRFTTLFCLAMLFVSGCSHLTTVSGVETIKLKSIPEKGEILGKALQSGKGIIVYVEKGDSLPVRITAELPFAVFDAGDNSLVATEDFYLYFSSREALISRDGISFAPLYDMKALKKLYGFERGRLSIGFSAGKEAMPSLSVGVATQP